MKSGKLKIEDILPSDKCLNTLTEAHRIVTGATIIKMNPRTLHQVQIRRFLSVPDSSKMTAGCLMKSGGQQKGESK